ncbi:hypothetical protein VPHD518_0068 [Vibrio phage D518]
MNQVPAPLPLACSSLDSTQMSLTGKPFLAFIPRTPKMYKPSGDNFLTSPEVKVSRSFTGLMKSYL